MGFPRGLFVGEKSKVFFRFLSVAVKLVAKS